MSNRNRKLYRGDFHTNPRFPKDAIKRIRKNIGIIE